MADSVKILNWRCRTLRELAHKNLSVCLGSVELQRCENGVFFTPVKYTHLSVMRPGFLGPQFFLWYMIVYQIYFGYKKQANKYKDNFTVNVDHSYKKKETRLVAYTCRYSCGHLIPRYLQV